MKDKKYIVIAGFINSKSDGDLHYISSNMLMNLYGVKPSECYVMLIEDYNRRKHMPNLKNLKVLLQNYEGDYSL